MPNARIAGPADVEAVTATIAAAFHDDPVWSWVFRDPEHRSEQMTLWWRFWVEGARPQRFVWLASIPGGEAAAAAVWIPPGGVEYLPADERRIRSMLRTMVGNRSDLVLEILDRFDVAHPRDEPHYYLSLLGTHPEHRGKGIGGQLLAENLARIDTEHRPCYLESTNSRNVARYEALGFVCRDEFHLCDGGPAVTTMWREGR